MQYINQKFLFLNVPICLIFFGCIDKITFNINENSDQLVIVGSISTKPGPYSVKVSRSSDFYSRISEFSNIVKDARVFISSDDGQVEELTHWGLGIYQSNPAGIQGELGRSYSLTVITNENKTYQSKREVIVETPQIDSIYFEYQEKEFVNENNIAFTKQLVSILVDYTDEKNEENYYSWTWKNTYQFETTPGEHRSPADLPDPLACSLFGCTCCTCWLTSEEKNDLAIISDKLTNGNKIKGQVIATIPITAREFQNKYHINASQKSLSKEAFDFWSLVKNQETSATLFATPPARITGNIKNINDPGEAVWGYFSASDISEKSFFIYPEDIPGVLIDTKVINDDCRSVNNATNKRPLFW